MERSRVLLIASYADAGGAEVVVQDILERADPGRYACTVVCLKDGRWPQALRERGYRVTVVPRTRLRDLRNGFGVVSVLRQIVRQENIDLLHASENSAFLYASLAGRSMRRPVVWHIYDPLNPTSALSTRMASILLSRLRPAHIIYASQLAIDGTPGFREVASSMVLPGVNVDRCRAGDGLRGRLALGIPEGNPLVSMFARVVPSKGQEDFLDCMARLRDAFPGLYGIICGAPAYPNDSYWRHLMSVRSRYGLEEAVMMPGYVPDELKADIVAGSDVVIHPAHIEAFGLAVAEAMAAGKAVVASDTDGPHMLIEHGTSGLLFPVGNVPELSDAVSGLLQSPAERARIGERASTRATEFSVEHMVREIEQVWKGVLEDHSFG